MKLGRALIVLLALFAASLIHPALAQAPTKLRFQSAYPPSGLAFENSKFFVERVRALSGGKLQIDMLPPGAVVPAFEVLDAVHKQVIDGAHSSSAYWLGKHRAAGLFSPTPGGPLGMDMIDYMGWIYDGGGLALYTELYQKEIKRNVVVFPLTSMAAGSKRR
jgi:TRAP-type mannitol/chloroaromatic compound transport system substrate-binding protein